MTPERLQRFARIAAMRGGEFALGTTDGLVWGALLRVDDQVLIGAGETPCAAMRELEEAYLAHLERRPRA
ncbi:MAG TPA: hypothetical protein VFL90_06325 [Methylomirabilota bacterium]|nr:hypothetical protein [Methylomirabilota bacterium]